MPKVAVGDVLRNSTCERSHTYDVERFGQYMWTRSTTLLRLTRRLCLHGALSSTSKWTLNPPNASLNRHWSRALRKIITCIAILSQIGQTFSIIKHYMS